MDNNNTPKFNKTNSPGAGHSAENLNPIYSDYKISGFSTIKTSERKSPVNLIILFSLFAASTYFFCVEKYDVLHAALPSKYRPLFAKIVGPFANEKATAVPEKAELAPPEPPRAPTADSEKNDQFITIEGVLMKYNPRGEYYVNGKLIIYHPKPGLYR